MAWNTLFKIKKIFSKIYPGVTSVYESIYSTIGIVTTPIVLLGTNGTGGNSFGSNIYITGSVTNNSVLSISSSSYNSALTSLVSVEGRQVTGGGSTANVQTDIYNYSNVDTITINVGYQTGGNPTCASNEGYFRLYVDGVLYYTSPTVTDGSVTIPDTLYLSRTMYLNYQKPPLSYKHYSFCRTFMFNSRVSIRVDAVFSCRTTAYTTTKIMGVIQTQENLTRDIYATVIEQVNPSI